MKTDLRKSGIEIVGDVPWGTHFCQFYQSREDLIETLVPYFKEGLENNEFCMWVTAEPLNVEDAKSALREKVKDLDDYFKKGQIEILDYSQWYTKTGRFDADTVLEGWVKKEKQAIERGFDGLRFTGNTFWLEKKEWGNFTNYEAVVNNVIGKHRMLAICSYSLDKCQAPEVIEVINNHQFALIKKEGKWMVLESVERRKAEMAIQQSEERYQKQFEEAIDAIFLADSKTGMIVNCNIAAEKLVEREKLEIIGKHQSFLHPAEDVFDGFSETFNKHVAGKAAELLEDRIITKSGQIKNVAIRASKIIIDGKEVMQGIFRDVTGSKQREEKLKKAELELKQIQEKLNQIEKISAKGELAAGIVHEIRNPLSVISMSVQYLQTKFDTNDPRREYTESIIQKVEKLDRIARGLADYSRSPRLDLKSRNINGILAQTLSLVKPKCKLNNIQISHNLKQHLPLVELDEEKIDQVFLNIIKNALDAMPKSGKLIIDTGFDKTAAEVYIKIADTGCGIKSENLDKIFIPFFTSKKAKDGIGLGLAISQDIIQAHRGSISVASKTKGINKGTTFTIKLPVTTLKDNDKSNSNVKRI